MKMTQLKLLSAALLSAAVIASPAMARHHHAASQYSPDEGYVVPAQSGAPYYAYANHRNDVRCVSAPRVGQFASEQWDNDVPCIPGTMTY
jgi:hypothetical protein